MSPIIEATNLSHAYGSFQALTLTDFSLEAGQVAVIEGPNGSGKSTFLLCLSGLLRPTTGQIKIDGFDIFTQDQPAHRALAFVPDVPRFYIELTAWEHLRFLALAHGAQAGFEARAEKLLKAFGLWEARDLFPHLFSRGMSLKLGVLFALIRPFKVLLLDEPTSAMDAESSELLRQHLQALRQEGAAILLSTHDPDIKQGLADHVYRIEKGCLTSV
ncbi:MAG TPA: ABC transporter ATP-binding protein [Anaerolineales bacterium]|nr:ABC transporter ATP-binding protein [Anaerolineales bacterium]